MKIKNINTRVLATSLSLVMATTFLSGCHTNFNYITDDKGNIQIEGTSDYEIVRKYKIIEIAFNGIREIYLVNKSEYMMNCCYYHDVFTNLEILLTYKGATNGANCVDSEIKLINEKPFNDYLLYYDELKDSYSEEDLRRILDKIKHDYVFEIEEVKTLVKERN